MRARLKDSLWQWRGVWLTAPAIAGFVILLRFAGLLQAWEWGVVDQYFRLRPQEAVDNRVVIVGIDEADVQEIGRALIPDGSYAQLLKKLKAMQPRAIGLDVYRDLPVQPGHQDLVKVFETTPTLVGIQKVVGDIRREAVAPPPFLKGKPEQVGANDLLVDADNEVRRGLIYVADRTGENVFSFSLVLALHYLEAQGIQPRLVDGTNNWQLGQTIFRPFAANDGGYVRAEDFGYQLLLNYRGPARHFETVSMTDILQGRVPPDWGRDRIVLIGHVGESFQDLYFTPYSSGLLTLPERMPGVEIHANLTSQILSAALDGRPLINTWSEPWEWVWILLWSGAGATLSWRWRHANVRKSLLLQRTAGAFLVCTLLGSSYAAFLWGWWIPIVPPFLAFVGAAVAITTYIAHTAGEIRKTFGRYLTNEVVANLLERPEGLKLGGESRTITILTSDLRGFTSISEGLQPQEVVRVLNLYLGEMAEVISSYQGTIDEFMGDGILVLFGAPTSQDDDPARAVACAVAMQLAMSSINQKLKALDFPGLQMGIGINTGEVVVGNIGSEKRAKYSVIGSQVNLTYRIESYTTGGQILISEQTFQEVEPIVKINGHKQVQPKGVKQPIQIYDIGGITGRYNLFLPKEEEEFLPLPQALPLRYQILDGKHIGETSFKGRLVKLSNKGALVNTNQTEETLPAPLNDLKLNLLPFNNFAETSEDIYAKVLEKSANNGSFYINFTAKSSAVSAKLDALYRSLRN